MRRSSLSFAGASGPARPQTGATFNHLLVNCPPDTCKNKGGGPGGARPGVPPHPAGSGRAGPGCWGRIRMGIRPSRCGRSPGHKGLFLRALTGTFFKGLEVITRCCFFFLLIFFFPPPRADTSFCPCPPHLHLYFLLFLPWDPQIPSPLSLLANAPPGC